MAISVKELLGYALDSGASDLHLSVGNIPMLRIHGEMKKIKSPALDLKAMEKIRDEVLNSNQKKIFKDDLEIDFSAELIPNLFNIADNDCCEGSMLAI